MCNYASNILSRDSSVFICFYLYIDQQFTLLHHTKQNAGINSKKLKHTKNINDII